MKKLSRVRCGMKKLALISPKSSFFSDNRMVSSCFSNTFSANANNMIMSRYAYWTGGNSGLLVLAALTPSDFEIYYIDENYETINFQQKYDLVGISAMTQQATRAYGIADEFRERGVKVVIGGIHATVLPEEAKEHADAVVIGEAENIWHKLLQDLIVGEIKPFYKSAVPVDLSKSPIPRYDLLRKYDYKMVWVQTSRGCPRDCEFCCASNIYGKQYRHKTVDQVLNEIGIIRNLWNDHIINFTDDNMFVNKEYSYELLKRLGGAGIRWTAQADVSVADDSRFIELICKSGCKLLFIGFETLNKKGKIDMHGWKQNRIESYPEVIRKIQSRGVGVLGAFIIGLDDDDNSIFDQLSEFIISNRLYASQISVLTPLPGTKLRERLLGERRILSDDWGKYTFLDVNYLPKLMSTAELQGGLLKIYDNVYSKAVRVTVMKHFMSIYAKLQDRERQFN